MSPEITFPRASAIEPETGRILCAGCEQPILSDDLGGFGKSQDGGEAWFHSGLPCMMSAASHMVSNHATELRQMCGRNTIAEKKEEYRGHSKPIPF